MSTSWPSILKRHCGQHLFQTRSRITGAGSTIGFVVDFSQDLILFHVLNTDIGPLISMTKATFTIDDLDSNAEWTGPRRLKFSDVTRVDFGGGYEHALAVTAPKRPKLKK
jgi:hypothetical protein